MTMPYARTTGPCCRNRRFPPQRASARAAWRFWSSDSSRSPEVGFNVHGHLQRRPDTLRLGGRARRETLYRVKVRGTLQTVQKSHHAAIVAYHLSVDGQFRQVAAFHGFGVERAAVQPEAGFGGKRAQLGADRRISGALREKRMLECIAILLNRRNAATDFLSALDILFQQVAIARHQHQFLLRALRRGQVPTVEAEGHVGGDEERQQEDNGVLFKVEIAAHQLLAYTTVS